MSSAACGPVVLPPDSGSNGVGSPPPTLAVSASFGGFHIHVDRSDHSCSGLFAGSLARLVSKCCRWEVACSLLTDEACVLHAHRRPAGAQASASAQVLLQLAYELLPGAKRYIDQPLWLSKVVFLSTPPISPGTRTPLRPYLALTGYEPEIAIRQ